MKLAKLLGAGKSFFGGRGVVSYRESKHVYLPKFNDAGKNPFAPKPKEAEVAEVKPVAALVSAPAEIVAVPPAPVVAAKAVVKPQPIVSAPVPQAVVAKPARAGWAGKLNPFRAPQPVVPSEMPAVQPEFSLDAVKVLHNDLSDADVEVVPVKSRTVAPVALVSARAEYMAEPAMRTI